MHLFIQVELRCLLIKMLGGSLLNGDGSLGAFSETGTKAITICLANEFCLAINNLKSSLSTGWHAEPTAVTLLSVNSYDFSL